MAHWVCGAAKDLPVSDADGWDGQAAQDSLFSWAGWPDDPNPAKAKRGFLAYDTENSELKGSYKFPIARVINGKPTVMKGGLSAAKAYLEKADLPQPVKDAAAILIEDYQKKLGPAKKSALGPAERFSGLYETFDALSISDEGLITFASVKPMSDQPGFDGYLIPWYTLSDRGSFFVPGSAKKTAKEQLGKAQVLYQHYRDVPIGKHVAAKEDDTGFRISAAINEGVQAGAEVMSNLRFGVPMGLSVGYDAIGDRTGTEEDDQLLNRKTAPDYVARLPINELRAITAMRWWESSVVTWPAIATAAPDEIRSAARPSSADLLTALRSGRLAAEEEALIRQIVEVYQARAAVSTRDHLARRRLDVELDAMLLGFELPAVGVA